MKIKRAPVMFFLSIALIFIYFFMALLNTDDILSVFGTVAVSVPLVIYIACLEDETPKNRAYVLLSAAGLSFAINALGALIGDGAPFGPSLQKGLASLFFLLPIVVITFSDGSNRLLQMAVTALFVLVTLPCLYVTVSTYYYLFSEIGDYSSFLTCMALTSLMLLLSSFSELIFRAKRNYLSEGVLLAAVFLSVFAERARTDTGYIYSRLPLTITLILFIYVSREMEERYSSERKAIVLTNMKTQEIEHLRKKKKPRVYDIPPNVPVNDKKNDVD